MHSFLVCSCADIGQFVSMRVFRLELILFAEAFPAQMIAWVLVYSLSETHCADPLCGYIIV